MYLFWFERIVRSAIQVLDEVDDETKSTWALPFWNYSSGFESRRLPRAFLDRFLADGSTPNPLRVPGRNLNTGGTMPSPTVGLTQALAPSSFAGNVEFGGARTSWNHFNDDPAAAASPLEITPHGAVHVQVGGLMANFDTAGLDPLFWLHHANIDRLWEVWLGMPGRANTTESAWLSGETFHFHDENGVPKSQQVADVLDPQAQLNYRYDGIPSPGGQFEEAQPVEPEPHHPAELVGATDQPVDLTGDTSSVTFGVTAPTGPLGAEAAVVPSRVLLEIEDVTSPDSPGVTYAVYVNVPDDNPATDDEHYVGTASFFGIEEQRDPDNEHPGMRLGFDITDLHHRLDAEGRWRDQVSVTFVPLYVEPGPAPERGDDQIEIPEGEALVVQEPGTVRVGRVSVFFQ